MNPITIEQTSETAPLKPSEPSSSALSVESAGRIVGSTFFLVSALLASIIPAIELGIGAYYNGNCPINQLIATYMIVAGSCGLLLVGLAILLAITFLCFISDSAALTIVASCGICLNIAVTMLVSFFLFIWFICGCVWVFSVADEVQFKFTDKNNYCNPVLYKWTFALLIVTFMWAFIQCCISCFRTCCVGRGF